VDPLGEDEASHQVAVVVMLRVLMHGKVGTCLELCVCGELGNKLNVINKAMREMNGAKASPFT
jgi:hypothetical protein